MHDSNRVIEPNAGPAESTRARLLEAAGEEFSSLGYEGATIRSIALRAGANLAAVNYHFGDKESLYEQVVIHAHRMLVPHEPHEEAVGMPPREGLRVWIRSMLGQVLGMQAQRGWQHELILREMMRPTRASAALVREVIGPRFGCLRLMILAIRPDLDDRSLNAFCFSVVGQCLFYRTAGTLASHLVGEEAFHALDLDFLSGHISELMLAGLESRLVVPVLSLSQVDLPNGQNGAQP